MYMCVEEEEEEGREGSEDRKWLKQNEVVK